MTLHAYINYKSHNVLLNDHMGRHQQQPLGRTRVLVMESAKLLIAIWESASLKSCLGRSKILFAYDIAQNILGNPSK